MNTIELEKTCDFCPEQYWARKGPHIIGYIRLRWGHLTCHYLLQEGQLSRDDIKVYDYVFEGDEYKGSFDTEEERTFHLEKCKKALMEKYNELKKKNNKK